ncbi:MAG: molybdopterin-dependent oxidoreductase, partial [Thermoanaerobaculia bacterium]|nr:molybdopterin-dependent oxidoreductase [Thermoanaerobaculia bacterium]
PAVPGGWLLGTEAAPNSRGAEAAGVARAGKGSALARLLDGSHTPDVLYVADAEFTARTADPAFVASLRRAKTLVVHGRRTSPLTEAADVLLPVASLAGKEGTFVNVLGLVQRFQLAVVPPPIVRTDLEVLLHLGKRWGVFDPQWTAKAVFERMRESVPGYAGLEWDAPALVGNDASASPVSAYDVLLERRLAGPAEILAEAAAAAGGEK